MYNTYVSSTLLSLGSKGSISICLNDYPGLLNERFERNPSGGSSPQCCSCCSCCCCCCCSSSSSSFASTHRFPVNPGLFYGLRQSSLIQCSPTRRVVLGGRDRYYSRVSGYGLDHGSQEFSCSSKEKSGRERIERKENGRVRRVKLQERRCFGVEDVEAVISLLSEEVSEEYLGGRVRNERLAKKVDTEKRGSHDGCGRKGRKKSVGLNVVGSDSKCEAESSRVELRKEECRRKEEEMQEKEEKRAASNVENRRGRKASSSSVSSYYSVSSADDFESDKEARDGYGYLLEESSSALTDLRSGEGRLEEEEAVEEYGRHRDGERQESLERRTSGTRTGVEWDLRKKSEKKLSDVGETQSRYESSLRHGQKTSTYDSDYRKASISHQQIDEVDERASKVSLEQEKKKTFNQVSNKNTEQSEFRRNYQETTDLQKIVGTNVERTSLYQNKFSGEKESLTASVDLVSERTNEHHKTVGATTETYSSRRKTEKSTDKSRIENVSIEGVSDFQRQSESRMKILEEEAAQRSAWNRNQQAHRMGELTAKMETRRNRQQLSEASEIHASSLQSERRIKNREENVGFVSGSGAEAMRHGSLTDEKVQQGVQSGAGSSDVTNLSVNVTNVSVIDASTSETIINSQGTSEKRMVDQGSELTSVGNSTRRTGNIDTKIDTNFSQAELRGEVHGGKVSNFHGKSSQQISSSQESFSRVSPDKVQQINLEDSQRSSKFLMMPASSQLVATGSLHVGSSGGLSTQEEPYGRDGKGVDYQEPSNLSIPADALGSSHRLEVSSTQFVGEFLETARHEVSTSEIQTKQTAYGAKSVHESEEGQPKNLVRSGESKKWDSGHSSDGLGVKGPSDEIWDVKEPSASEVPETKAQEGSPEIKDIVVERTGRSLWSMIANLFKLSRASRAETPKSSRKSGKKSSSVDSAGTEAWFSGQEPDEISDDNTKRRRKKIPTDVISSQQPQLRQGEAEDSDTIGSKDKRRQDEAGTSSASMISKSGSTSKGSSSPPEEENLAPSQDEKRFQIVGSSMEVGESSLLPLPSSDSLLLDKSSGTATANVSVGSSTELIGQEIDAKLTVASTSEVKSAELKRRKFQRSEQLVRDRFDEWEEAYKLESEQKNIDEMFMREALLEAKKAADTWEVPVGAVLVQHGKIIARGYNLVEELRDSTAHAEMICIREASQQLRSWRLAETTLYVTLEPCPMCAGAILQARIDTLVWGAPNKLLGADGSWIRLFPNGGEGGSGSELTDKPAAPVHPFHPNMKIRRGILASECADAMQQFFQLRRRKKEKKQDPPPESSSLPIDPKSKILNKMHDIFHVMFCL